MVKYWMAAGVMALFVAAVSAQEPEFAATAPAKVLLPIAQTDARPTEVPGAAPLPAAASGEIDPKIAEIGAEMAVQDAAEKPDTATGTEPPPPEASPVPSPLKTVGKGFGALCATLVLILLLFAALKRWGKRTPLLAGQQLARVLGRVGLSPQASLHFVQTNGEVLVIGVTQQNVSLLRTFDASDFERAVEVAPAEKTPAPAGEPATSFLAQLKESRAAMGAEATVDEDLDQLKGELQRLKQYFQDSTRARE